MVGHCIPLFGWPIISRSDRGSNEASLLQEGRASLSNLQNVVDIPSLSASCKQTVEFDRLVRDELPKDSPQCKASGAKIRGEGDDESVVRDGFREGRCEDRRVSWIAFGHRLVVM